MILSNLSNSWGNHSAKIFCFTSQHKFKYSRLFPDIFEMNENMVEKKNAPRPVKPVLCVLCIHTHIAFRIFECAKQLLRYCGTKVIEREWFLLEVCSSLLGKSPRFSPPDFKGNTALFLPDFTVSQLVTHSWPDAFSSEKTFLDIKSGQKYQWKVLWEWEPGYSEMATSAINALF